jgi:hypothetical protein
MSIYVLSLLIGILVGGLLHFILLLLLRVGHQLSPLLFRQFPDSSQIRPRQFRLGSNFYLRPALLFDYVTKITSKCIKIDRSCTSRFWPNIDFITAIEPLLQCRHLLLDGGRYARRFGKCRLPSSRCRLLLGLLPTVSLPVRTLQLTPV